MRNSREHDCIKMITREQESVFMSQQSLDLLYPRSTSLWDSSRKGPINHPTDHRLCPESRAKGPWQPSSRPSLGCHSLVYVEVSGRICVGRDARYVMARRTRDMGTLAAVMGLHSPSRLRPAQHCRQAALFFGRSRSGRSDVALQKLSQGECNKACTTEEMERRF
jgi:hypothetical protein